MKLCYNALKKGLKILPLGLFSSFKQYLDYMNYANVYKVEI